MRDGREKNIKPSHDFPIDYSVNIVVVSVNVLLHDRLSSSTLQLAITWTHNNYVQKNIQQLMHFLLSQTLESYSMIEFCLWINNGMSRFQCYSSISLVPLLNWKVFEVFVLQKDFLFPLYLFTYFYLFFFPNSFVVHSFLCTSFKLIPLAGIVKIACNLIENCLLNCMQGIFYISVRKSIH